MTTAATMITDPAPGRGSAAAVGALGRQPIWRIVRLHAVSPATFFGIPWIIVASAWVVSMIIGAILMRSGTSTDGMSYSWAVLTPQWYLVVVGVQAVSFTFPFALGFGATRRDFWLGTVAMFVLVALTMAVGMATLGQLEHLTDGWGIGITMFTALWYGDHGWLVAFYTTFCLQLFVLCSGAAATAVYMRWRTRGMLVLVACLTAVVLTVLAVVALTRSWGAVLAWFTSLGLSGGFTIVLATAVLAGIGGYVVIRRATPR